MFDDIIGNKPGNQYHLKMFVNDVLMHDAFTKPGVYGSLEQVQKKCYDNYEVEFREGRIKGYQVKTFEDSKTIEVWIWK